MNKNMMRGLGRLGKYGSMSGYGTFGAECQPGFYQLKVFGVPTGQCLPTGTTLREGLESGAAGVLATGVATSPATQAAATSAAGQAIGQRIIGFYQKQPVVAIGSTLAVGALLVYGTMKALGAR